MDVTPPHPTTSAAPFRTSQRTLGRPLKEDSFNMTQLLKAWMHLFLALKDKGKFGFESGMTKTIRLRIEFRGTELQRSSAGQDKNKH